MKTRTLKILSYALLAAVLLYFLVQGLRYLSDPYTTTRVYTSTSEDTIDVSGWLVREEECFSTGSQTISHNRQEGERVGLGQTIATTYDSPGALETVEQIRAKELQLEQLEYALSSYLNPDAALKLDGSISDNILSLRRDLSGGDYTAVSEQLSQLKAAVVKRSRAYTSSKEIETEIAAVKSEIASLQGSLSGASDITAPRAGTYSAVCDGYETVLTPQSVKELSPSQLDALSAVDSQANVGKLIYSSTWYYAAAVTEEEAQRIAQRGSVSLRLSKGVTDDIDATVCSVSPAEDGRCVVVLSCREYLAQTAALRHQTAQLVLRTYTGLRVPSVALRMNEKEQLGVYCAQGNRPIFKRVELVYQGDNYALVEVPAGVEGLYLLRPGDEVLLTGVTLDGSEILDGQ